MKMFKIFTIAIVIALFSFNHSYGQGCSDAGFCTINSFKPNDSDSTKVLNKQFKIGTFAGDADNSIFVYGNYFEFNKQLNKRLGIDAKLTTLAQNGNGISTFGLSDFYINLNYAASEKLKLTLGFKVPLSNANKTYQGLSLPMDYQASLGTFDLIFGMGYEIKKIQLVAAIQQPLTQNNNRFLATDFSLSSGLSTFPSTNQFERSGDMLLRISYPFSVHSKFRMTPSVLPIYHLKNDKFTDEFNVKREIEGSQGLTLNGNIYFDYEINEKNSLQLNVGMPFVVRNTRPDGLTRSFIANLEYRIKF